MSDTRLEPGVETMPNDRSNELYVKARQVETMRAAQRQRLIAEAQASRPRAVQFHTRIYRQSLAWFRRSLVALGQGLQHKAKFPSQANHR
jgi:hypothetical protein